MDDEASPLTQGIDAARAGDKRQARELLAQVVRNSPNSALAWLWLSSVLDTPQGRAYCLQRVLELEPSNQAAQRGLAALAGARPASVVVAHPAEQEVVRSLPAAQPGEARPVEVAAAPATGGRERRAGLASQAGAAWGRVRAWRPSVPSLPKRASQPPVRERPPGLTPPGWWARATSALGQARFWKIAVGCLAAVAVGLVALLLFASSEASRPDSFLAADTSDRLAPAAQPILVANSRPRATLRPTFTPLPTQTPVVAAAFANGPLATFTPTGTPTPIDTVFPRPPMLPTFTPTHEATPTRRQQTSGSKPPAPSATPRPPLPPRSWDPRLDALRVRVEPAIAQPGQGYWRLIEARWTNGAESGGRHAIYVEVLSERGGRAVGQPVIFEWSTGSDTLPAQNPPPPDWSINFPMYSTLGSYSARVVGAASDKVVGMGMGEANAPDFTIHTCFYLTFRWVQP